jgi:poly-gamma-glutamate synthesis protein (capsule biosynthesis protein)
MADKINILITGDFYGGNRVEEVLLNKQYDLLFNDFLPYIRNADLSITNLESPLIINGQPIKKTGPNLKSNPELINAIKYAGFNLLTLANNHILDYGKAGLLNTINLCKENNIDFVGVGDNYESASQIYFKKIKGVCIAIINICENEWSTASGNNAGAYPLNPIDNFYKIKEAKDKADIIVVIYHGGHENYPLPSIRIKKTFHFFIDAGANVIIGHHPHCYSGFEIYKNSPIFYSLGNFIFDSKSPKKDSWYEGIAVNLSIDIENIKINFEVIPYMQFYKHIGVKLLKDQSNFQRKFNEFNKIIQDDNLLEERFNYFVNRQVSQMYRGFLEPISNRLLIKLQKIGILPSFLSCSKRRLYLNLIRCESHHEAIIKLLTNDCIS